MKRLLVSACLLGQPLRYDGDDNASKVAHLYSLLQRWQQQGRLIPVCPETLGGLPTPRPPAEITNASAEQILNGQGSILTEAGEDVTQAFIQGAQRTLEIAHENGADGALLAARSPSCGHGEVYDGQFQRQLTQGDGVTTALLKRHGIRCFRPADSEALIAWMAL